MMTITPLKGAGSSADVRDEMPVRRQAMLAPVLPTLPREDAAERKPRRDGVRPRVKVARASGSDVEAGRAALHDLDR